MILSSHIPSSDVLSLQLDGSLGGEGTSACSKLAISFAAAPHFEFL